MLAQRAAAVEDAPQAPPPSTRRAQSIVGDCLVTADQPGDRNFNPAPSVKRPLPIIFQPFPP
jgi:hypothetical protein